jgi:hypothetical protein
VLSTGLGIDAPQRRFSGADAGHAICCMDRVQPNAVYVCGCPPPARDNPLAACLLFDKRAWFPIPPIESIAIALKRHALLFMRDVARGMASTFRRQT